MVISFSVKEARTQLLTNGTVVTFRWTRRSHFKKGKDSPEKTWANRKRGEQRLCNVLIEELDRIPVEIDALEPYVDLSGFNSVESWYDKIWSMTQPYLVDSHGYIYRVTLDSQQKRTVKQ